MFPFLRHCQNAILLLALSTPPAVLAAEAEPAAELPMNKAAPESPPPRPTDAATTPNGESPAKAGHPETPPYGAGFEARQRGWACGGAGGFGGFGRLGAGQGGRVRGR